LRKNNIDKDNGAKFHCCNINKAPSFRQTSFFSWQNFLDLEHCLQTSVLVQDWGKLSSHFSYQPLEQKENILKMCFCFVFNISQNKWIAEFSSAISSKVKKKFKFFKKVKKVFLSKKWQKKLKCISAFKNAIPSLYSLPVKKLFRLHKLKPRPFQRRCEKSRCFALLRNNLCTVI